jgi:ABC-2 type transport system ATP-binding protein
VIEMEDVAIRYIVGDFREIGLKDYVMQRLRGQYTVQEFWAVDGVTLTLAAGDFLGIVGANGAGKSTLLKAVAGIMRPTRGALTVRGGVAALLELGSGFDGDMTVRENTFLRGALLGYTRAFMNEMYEEIIRFAELKEFQNRPFRQLSSGMKARLAFSIACLVKPEVLILDEVLSVGDGAFQRKSEAKMLEVIKNGATTLFVSHSLRQTRKLCNKVLWLEKGKQMAFGKAEEVCDLYEGFLERK